MRSLILCNHLPPGDTLVMSSAIYSLHRAYPWQYQTAVDTDYPDIWLNNPDIAPLEKAKAEGWEQVAMHYPLVHESNNRAVHVMDGYTQFLAHALQRPIPLATNRPLLYLSFGEKGWSDQVQSVIGRKQKFWILCSGGKADFTCKTWPWYQDVVDNLQGRVFFVQVGKLTDIHKPLKGVLNLLGQTDVRQLIRLCYHAQGVLCGVTFLTHVAAALSKPAVVIAGAREPRQWNSYPGQLLLNNVGTLPCSVKDGLPMACWRSRTVRMGDGSGCDQSLCEAPVTTDPPAPKCMTLISAADVVRAIESYYEGGRLSY